MGAANDIATQTVRHHQPSELCEQYRTLRSE